VFGSEIEVFGAGFGVEVDAFEAGVGVILQLGYALEGVGGVSFSGDGAGG